MIVKVGRQAAIFIILNRRLWRYLLNVDGALYSEPSLQIPAGTNFVSRERIDAFQKKNKAHVLFAELRSDANQWFSEE